MHRELIHLYGPFAINSFGLIIIIGLIIFSALILSDPKRPKILCTDQYFNILSIAIIVGLMGGRLLWVISNWDSIDSLWQIAAFWQGGFSLLGAVVTLLLVMPFYFKKEHINAIAFLDLAACYAPLLQSISRFGCFFAGCCFGIPTSLPFGIINPECSIPSLMNKPLHPTQLYSALALFMIFLLLYFIVQYTCKYPGQLLCVYLLLMSAERFIVDFWRGDREFLSQLPFLSISQLLALSIGIIAGFIFITLLYKHKRS